MAGRIELLLPVLLTGHSRSEGLANLTQEYQ